MVWRCIAHDKAMLSRDWRRREIILHQQRCFEQPFLRQADLARPTRTRCVHDVTGRFEGQVGEQATMFFLDPAGNALECKAFSDPSQLFAN